MKQRNFFFIVFASIMLSACTSMMRSDLSVQSEVVEHSYIQKTGGRLVEDGSRVTDLLNIGYDVDVIESNTWKVPNVLGNGFLLAVKFSSIPADISSFDLKVSFPEMTLPSGEKRSTVNREIDLTGHNGEYMWVFDFYFDFAYETNPGPWNLQVFSGDYKIHSSTFHVIENREKL